MADIRLTPLTVADAAALSAFEVRNRVFFEEHVGPRPDFYWDVKELATVITIQIRDDDAMFLIRSGNEIIGRLNLTSADGGVAQLGYRVGQAWCGQGVASAAVRLAFDEARRLGLWALEARVRADNPASGRVLEKTGFHLTGAEGDFRLFRADLDVA